MFVTPAGEVVGREHDGPKRKLADSRKEYRRLLELQQLERTGAIRQLRTQVRFVLRVNGVKVATYFADSTYIRGGRLCVEDVKGAITPVYKIKRALMLAIHGIRIIEVK